MELQVKLGNLRVIFLNSATPGSVDLGWLWSCGPQLALHWLNLLEGDTGKLTKESMEGLGLLEK